MTEPLVTLPLSDYMALKEKAENTKIASEHIRMTEVKIPSLTSPFGETKFLLEIDDAIIPYNKLPDTIGLRFGEANFLYHQK